MRAHSKWRQLLLLLELAVGFGPIMVLLAVGLFMTPFQILLLIASDEARGNPGGPVFVVGLSVLGTLASASLINVASVVFGRPPILGRGLTIWCGLIGLGILFYLAVDSDTFAWRSVFVAALVVGIHFAYLARDSLFARENRPG